MSYAHAVVGSPTLGQVAKLLMDSKVESIEPQLDETGYRYIFIEKALALESAEAVRVLEQLANRGYLEKQLLESVLACPDCGFFYMALKPVCPTCSSGRLLKGNVIEHLICGHVDFEQEFHKRGFECPKCNKELQALGVDYRRAGSYYKCVSCGRISALPTKKHVCGKCLRASLEEELTVKEVYRYIVLHDRLSGFYGVLDISPLVSYFQEKAVRVVGPAVLTGSSGVAHEFTLYLNKVDGDPSTGVVLDVVSEVEDSKIYELFTKSFDVKAGAAFLLVLGGVSDTLMRLVKTFNIELINAGSMDELIEKARAAIDKKLDTLAKSKIVKEIEDLENLLKKL
ncbi:MAG: hypothetical protein RMH74_05535 [Candidatus Caldarchaeum sp.]|nr:hypothetical protein [Candidatus Caldarchaeum sp.]